MERRSREFFGLRRIIRAVAALAIVLVCVDVVGVLYVGMREFPPKSRRAERRWMIVALACWVCFVAASLIDGEIPYSALGAGGCFALLLYDPWEKARGRKTA